MILKKFIILSFIFVSVLVTSQPTNAFFQDYQEAEYAVGSTDEFEIENSKHYLSESLYLYTDNSNWYLMEIEMVEKNDTRTVFVGTVIDAKVERMLGRDMAASLPTGVVKALPDKNYFHLLPTQKL
jgi:hypothetical protein